MGNDSSQSNDEQILDEVDRLIWALLDEEISQSDFELLEGLLREKEEVRVRYIEFVGLHTNLYDQFRKKPNVKPGSKSPVLGSLSDITEGLAGSDSRPWPPISE